MILPWFYEPHMSSISPSHHHNEWFILNSEWSFQGYFFTFNLQYMLISSQFFSKVGFHIFRDNRDVAIIRLTTINTCLTQKKKSAKDPQRSVWVIRIHLHKTDGNGHRNDRKQVCYLGVPEMTFHDQVYQKDQLFCQFNILE